MESNGLLTSKRHGIDIHMHNHAAKTHYTDFCVLSPPAFSLANFLAILSALIRASSSRTPIWSVGIFFVVRSSGGKSFSLYY